MKKREGGRTREIKCIGGVVANDERIVQKAGNLAENTLLHVWDVFDHEVMSLSLLRSDVVPRLLALRKFHFGGIDRRQIGHAHDFGDGGEFHRKRNRIVLGPIKIAQWIYKGLCYYISKHMCSNFTWRIGSVICARNSAIKNCEDISATTITGRDEVQYLWFTQWE